MSLSGDALNFELDPQQQLIFQESSDKLFQQVFKIINPHDEPLAFKIKTTSPKHYCVRPNVGLIGPRSEQEVEVLLQPRKDKFLIMVAQSDGRSASEASASEYWNDLEANHKDKIAEKRLKCVFTVQDAPVAPTASKSDEAPDYSLSQAHERIKKLEILLAETKRAKGGGAKTSGIVPFELANQLNMVNSPQSMFPPLLVMLIALLAFLFGWLIS
jgi:hypothetical protein